MRVRAGGEWHETDALDLRARELDHDRRAVRAAIEGEADWLDCPAPGDLWEHVGCISPGMAVGTRAALAAAARSRGLRAPQDEQRRAVLERRAGIEVDPVETAPLRRRLAEASGETDRLRERVARLQGRVQAARADGGEAADEEDELATAIRRLSERETERAAARQALDRARTGRRAARDAREERRRLADRAANLGRAARRHLADLLEAEFRAAVADVPGTGAPMDPFETDPVTRALAVARVGNPRAPLVLDCGRFPHARSAADWLGSAVVRP